MVLNLLIFLVIRIEKIPKVETTRYKYPKQKIKQKVFKEEINLEEPVSIELMKQ